MSLRRLAPIVEMDRPPLLFVVLAALVIPPLALAHGGPPPSYDPLILNIDGWLTVDGKIAPSGPGAGIAYFAQYTPGSAAVPLSFTMDAPVAFSSQGFHVILSLRADKLLQPNAPDTNKALRLELMADGKGVKGASADMPFDSAIMQPGSFQHIDLTLTSPDEPPFAKGTKVALRLTPLGPALLDGSLGVVVGESSASTADFPFAKIPKVADLELQDPGTSHTQYDLVTENYTLPDATRSANDIEVYHDNIVTNYINVLGTRAYLTIKGSEDANTAAQYHAFPDRERRIAATHDFTFAGKLIRVHPGVGTVLDMDLTSGPATLECVKNCPQPFKMTLYPNRMMQAPGSMGTLVGGTNVTTTPTHTTPTQAATGTGTPEKRVPSVTMPLVFASVALLALARGRRSR
ncbi:MAG: hypothetical protein WDA16_03875 [Candidatus Thermoplasmatota archaeon]